MKNINYTKLSMLLLTGMVLIKLPNKKVQEKIEDFKESFALLIDIYKTTIQFNYENHKQKIKEWRRGKIQ